jgi:hypothetical protein
MIALSSRQTDGSVNFEGKTAFWFKLLEVRKRSGHRIAFVPSASHHRTSSLLVVNAGFGCKITTRTVKTPSSHLKWWVGVGVG